MFLAEAIHVLTSALKSTFAHEDYPEADFKGLHVSHEYPMEQQNYPGIWVDMNVTSLRTAGIGHYEEAEDEHGAIHELERWVFTGVAEFTLATLTSLERARLFDEVIKVMAFGDGHHARANFRKTIESNGLIRMSMDFDDLNTGGFAASPGTPWRTQDIIYEVTITQDVRGEFLSDMSSWEMVPLANVEVIAIPEGQPDPEPLPEDPAEDGWM